MGQTIGEIDLGLNVNHSLFNKQISGLARSAQSPIVNAFKPIGKMIGSALAVGSIVSFTKSCLDLGSDLTEVQNVVDTTFGSLSSAVDEFAAKAMTSFGMSETVAKKYMGTLGAMSKSMGFSEQASYDMASAVTGLAGDVASFYNLSTDEAFDKLKSIWTGETETLKSIGALLTQTNLDQYALNNGWGKTTANMTEQEKVMLRYQYTMSALSDAQGDFAKTSGSWANQTRILSLQFDSLKATLGQGFINLFTPIIQMINTLLAKLQTLAQQFKAFTEVLTGNKSDAGTGVSAVASGAKSAATELGGVEEAAKKAAKATRLLGIDEINKAGSSSVADTGNVGSAATNVQALNTATASTGGLIGGVNTELDSLTQKFETLVQKVEPFTDAVKRLWNGGLSKLANFTATGFKDFYESFLKPLGTWAFGTEDKGFTRLVNIINEDLCGVDWDTINQNLKDFWVAIEPYAEEFGEELIDFLEKASDLAFNGLEKLLGEDGLLNDLTNWLNGHDPEEARDWAKALTTLFTALLLFKLLKPGIFIISNLLKLFGKTPNLKTLGKGLATAGKGISKGFSAISGAVTSLGGFSGLMTTDLATIFGAGTATEIGVTIGTGLIGGILAAIGGFKLGKVLGKLLFPEAAEWYDNFHFFGEGGLFDSDLDLFNLDAITTAFLDSKKELISSIPFFSDEVKDAANSMITHWETDINNNGFWNALGSGIKNWYEGDVKPYFESGKWKGLWGVIKNIANEKWGEFCEWWEGSALVKWWEEDVSPWFTKERWISAYDNIKTSLTDKWAEIKEWWNSSALVVWWKSDVSPWFTKERWVSAYNNIKTSLEETWQSVKAWWDNSALVKWWRESVAPWFTKEQWFGSMTGIKDGFKEAFKNACNAGIEIFNKFIGWLNDKLNFSWDGLSILGKEIYPGGSVQLFTIPQIPKLAEGGYVGANQPRLAMIGDNKHYGEIVSPEDKMLQIMMLALEQFFSRLQSTGQPVPTNDNGDIIIPVYIGSEKIEEIIITAEQRRNMRSGGKT